MLAQRIYMFRGSYVRPRGRETTRSRPLSVGMASVSHTKRRKQVAASLASRRKRGDLTPPAVVASRDEPAVLRTRSRRLPGLSTAESEPFEPLDSTA